MHYLRKGVQISAPASNRQMKKRGKIMKNGLFKISKGYRLKLSTHQLIKNLKEITRADSDTVLNRSCKLYYKTILDQDEKSIFNNESNNNRNVE